MARPTIEERIWEYIAQLGDDDDVTVIEDASRAGINSLQIFTADGRIISVEVNDITWEVATPHRPSDLTRQGDDTDE